MAYRNGLAEKPKKLPIHRGPSANPGKLSLCQDGKIFENKLVGDQVEEAEGDAVVAEAADEVGRAGGDRGTAVDHPIHVEEEADVVVHAMGRAAGVPCRIPGEIVR